MNESRKQERRGAERSGRPSKARRKVAYVMMLGFDLQSLCNTPTTTTTTTTTLLVQFEPNSTCLLPIAVRLNEYLGAANNRFSKRREDEAGSSNNIGAKGMNNKQTSCPKGPSGAECVAVIGENLTCDVLSLQPGAIVRLFPLERE